MDSAEENTPMVSEEVLNVLPESDWPQLRDKFKTAEWPYGIFPYYLIENFINWKKKDAAMEVEIYTPKKPHEDATMILHCKRKGLETIYLFTLEKSCETLKESLSKTSLIDWKTGPLIFAVREDHWKAVKEALLFRKLPTHFQIQSTTYWLPREDALKFDITCPSDVNVRPLQVSDIPYINEVWPHRYNGSEDFLEWILKMNGGFGIYCKEDDSLRSWIMKNQHIGIGMLQTSEKHKKKGYANFLIKVLSKNMALEGMDIHTCIVRQNTVSQEMFKRLGFRKHSQHIKMDPLQEVYSDCWPQLDKLLKQNWPRSFIIYSWLNTRRKWYKKDPKRYNYHILCPNGNIQQGIVTFGRTGDRVFYLTVFTFDKDLSSLREALIKTKLIPWMDKFVCGVPQGIDLWFQDILRSHKCKVHHNTPTHYYRLPKEVAEKIEIKHDNDIYIDYLSNIDIPKINRLWDHKFEGSEHLLTECINMNYGVGVYSKHDGKLLSWGMKYEYSDVAVIKTEFEYRKRGYGKLVFQSLSKKIAEEGEDVITFIVPGNEASESITRNIGYKYVGTYNWLEYDLEKERSKL